ncbi:class I SAM-dependent methyltransferase [Nocardioides sp.]|uniref:class I SAM-dependent methyltransferase n=1 Tax=Nocardioides sp. TaxID=35761 RepID=UPI003526D5D2
MRPPDAIFADPRQAALYDVFDGDRSDLDAYVALAGELAADRVLDVGCGTGCLAIRLADEGLEVIGVDPAVASLEVARAKPGAERVSWVEGDATTVAGLDPPADLAVMTGNVAQVFVADDDWAATLNAVRTALRPGGWLVFETRRPEVRDWETWDIPPTEVVLPDGRRAVVERTVTEVAPPLVTFHGSTTIDGERLHSTSTLRFRGLAELERDLDRHGFTVVEFRDAPDRAGKEMVLLARRSGAPTPGPRDRGPG